MNVQRSGRGLIIRGAEPEQAPGFSEAKNAAGAESLCIGCLPRRYTGYPDQFLRGFPSFRATASMVPR
jgi:hypothetical protein